MSNTITPTVFYRTPNVEGLEIFYREAGPRDAPTVLLLHGFPSSSHMFKNAQVLLDWLLTIEGTKWHYLHGVSDPSKISPDNWVIDQAYQDRPGNKEIQTFNPLQRKKESGCLCRLAGVFP